MNKKRKLISMFCIIALTVTTVMSSSTLSFGASSKSKYWIKVNAQANVATVYKKIDKKWEPYRAMLCSCGTGKKGSGEDTPTGTYYVQSRWKWLQMVGGVYGRYVVQFYGDYLFHSVPYEYYGDLDSMPAKEFNKLGKDASHGCVRLSIMDSKWVYDNILRGTKVTVYNSKKPGPLGKPSGIKLPKKRKLTWDPTDPSKKNTKYQLPKPVITVADTKKTLVKYGSTYKLKSGVTAQDPNTFQNLTGLITVHKVRWYDSSAKKYVEKKFSTKRCGTYKVTYKVKYKYGGTTYKTLKIRVAKPLSAPKVSTDNQLTEKGNPILTWKAVAHATKYKIYRADEKKGPYKWICTTKKTTCTNVRSVEPGKCYYYKVKAVNAKGKYPDSAYSKVVKRVVPVEPITEVPEDSVSETAII